MSVELYKMKKLLENISKKQGRGTELISLYIPPGRDLSDVINSLKQEYGTAMNIKSTQTRKHVLDAITKVIQRLKLFKKVPENGLVVFCGAVSKGAPGFEEVEIYTIVPHEPIGIYLYRCDNKFHVEPLLNALKQKDVYGVLLLDGSEATFALIKGRRVEILKEITSGIPGKHRAGGQSARRFERLREAEMNEYLKRVANYAQKIFSQADGLRGIIIGGPGPTKYYFEREGYLPYPLRDKVLGVVDTSYTGESGVKEILEKSSEILRKVRLIEERKLIQKFLYAVSHTPNEVTYGESEVLEALRKGLVETLLVSENIDSRELIVTRCEKCNREYEKSYEKHEAFALKQNISLQKCPKCSNNSLSIVKAKNLMDELINLAEQQGANIEIISAEAEECEMLYNSFGGVAAFLRYGRVAS